MPGSSTWEDTYWWAEALEQAGADALNIGIGWHESRIPTISMLVPRRHYSFVSDRIRRHVRIPCICSNRINDPQDAERILLEGHCDFVSMARALLSDPELPLKARTGRADYVNTCIACNQACLDNAFRNEPTSCILNPEAGRETGIPRGAAEYRKRIAVVGAGPAGLEAARVLSGRGHRVTLFEKQDRIGGQLLFAVQVPGKQEFLNTLRYYSASLRELSVRLELGSTAAATDLLDFDAVLIATGARPNTPAIPGADLPHCMNYEAFFGHREPVGSNVVIIGAGGIGCDVAHMLADGHNLYPPPEFFDDTSRVSAYEEYMRSFPQTRTITLTRRGKRIGEMLGPTTRWALIQLLECRGVQMLTQVQYDAITPQGLLARTRAGKDLFLPADTIILATGQAPENALYQELKPQMEQCFLLGAARTASEANAGSAIREASDIANRL
jgi:2,4-dienoyl-CoA reductase (NADPH2)